MDAMIKKEMSDKISGLSTDDFVVFVYTLGKDSLKNHPPGRSKPTIDVDLLKISAEFYQEYKNTEIEIYKQISIGIRRAAHKLHRYMIKQKLTSTHKKFLRLL